MRNIQFKENEFYYVFNRGIEKRTIFLSKEEYDRFVAYLYLLNDERHIRPANYFIGDRKKSIFLEPRRSLLVAIAGYSLVPSEFHILLSPRATNGASMFMQRLQTAYTMYFNKKHHRTGSLFEGTFKALHARDDDSLRYLFSHVHLSPAQLFNDDWENASNPELVTLSLRVSEYQYSSIGEYLTGNKNITSPEQLPKFLSSKKDMRAILDMWLKFRKSKKNSF